VIFMAIIARDFAQADRAARRAIYRACATTDEHEFSHQVRNEPLWRIVKATIEEAENVATHIRPGMRLARSP
jgi:hypothetical protein